MREITKTFKVYRFEELKEEVKEKVKEKIKREIEEDFCEFALYDVMWDRANELLKENFGEKAKIIDIFYDLDYSQGSGAMIAFELNYYNIDIVIEHRGNYYHEYTFYLKYNDYEYLGEKREKQLEKKIIEMNKKLKNFGYNLIENCINEENVEDILKMNEYFENGDIYE